MPATIWSVGELVLAAKMNKLGAYLLWDSTDAGVTFPTATITTASLDQSFGSLLVLWLARSAAAALSANLYVRPNGDATAANYNSEFIRGVGTVAPTAAEQLGTLGGLYLGDIPCATAESANSGLGLFLISGYSLTASFRKPMIGFSMAIVQAASGTTGFIQNALVGGRWSGPSSAITTLSFLTSNGNFNSATDSRISVYGIPA